ncbi:MAG: hypothetical protein ACOH2D_00935 [Gelidibacter sp.]
MKEDNLDRLFKNLENEFDNEMPEDEHEQRFLGRLKSNSNVSDKKPKRTFYKPFLAIAASIVLCFGLFFFIHNKPQENGLASVSPELSQTKDFFTAAITSELNKIRDQRSPENEMMVSDALKQMELLEKNYERLKIDLKDSGNDKRVIYAMISNFQSRIELLENVLKTIEDIKQLKEVKQNQMTL